MGRISTHNNVEFEDSKYLFSKIKRRLKSFSNANLLDENDFYEYTFEILERLAMGVLEECDAVIEVVNGKAVLPDNLKYIYSVHQAEIADTKGHPIRQNGYVFYTDTTYEKDTRHCKIDCSNSCAGKITVREYIQGQESIYNFDIKLPLDFTNSNNLNINQVSLSGRYLNLGFKTGSIYIKYYGQALDDQGLPLIPKIESVQRAIEFYIIYNCFLNWYLNDDVPNGVERKAADMRAEFERYFGQANFEVNKLPRFSTTVGLIKLKRRSLDTYRQIE